PRQYREPHSVPELQTESDPQRTVEPWSISPHRACWPSLFSRLRADRSSERRFAHFPTREVRLTAPTACFRNSQLLRPSAELRQLRAGLQRGHFWPTIGRRDGSRPGSTAEPDSAPSSRSKTPSTQLPEVALSCVPCFSSPCPLTFLRPRAASSE